MNEPPKLHWSMSTLWLIQALFMIFIGCFILWASFFSPVINDNPPDKVRETRIAAAVLCAAFTWKGQRTFRYWRATKT